MFSPTDAVPEIQDAPGDPDSNLDKILAQHLEMSTTSEEEDQDRNQEEMRKFLDQVVTSLRDESPSECLSSSSVEETKPQELLGSWVPRSVPLSEKIRALPPSPTSSSSFSPPPDANPLSTSLPAPPASSVVSGNHSLLHVCNMERF